MPFPTRVIPNRTDIPEVIHNNQVKNMLEKASVSNMVGLLQQLNILSQHASQVFGGLLEDTTKTSGRIAKVKNRLLKVEQKVGPIEDIYLKNPPSFFYDNPYTDSQWSRKDQMRGFLFRRDGAPKAITKRREIGEVPPDLSALDKFTKDKQPCIKKYSDTDFFMNEWLQEQQLKMEEERKKRKLRKEQRKKRKQLKRAKTKKIMKVQKKVYSSLGAEFKGEKTQEEQFVETRKFDIDNKGLMSQTSSYLQKSPKQTKKSKNKQQKHMTGKTSTGTTNTPKQQKQISPQPKLQMKASVGMTNTTPKNPIISQKQTQQQQNRPMTVPVNQKVIVDTTQPQQRQQQPPPIPTNSSNNDLLPPIPGHKSEPSYVQNNVPPPFNPTHVPTETLTDFKPGPMTPEMMILKSREQAEKRQLEEERLKELKRKEYEKQKQKASLMVGGPRNFLSQIKSGTNLRKVDLNKIKREKPKDNRSLLMQSLQKGAKLRKVDTTKLLEKKKKEQEEKEAPSGGIFEILKRRQLIADSSSEDSGSDWGSDEE